MTDITVEVYNGTTLIKTVSAQLLDNILKGYDVFIPNSELSGVVFPANIRLRFTATGAYAARVTNVYMEEYGSISPPSGVVDPDDIDWEATPNPTLPASGKITLSNQSNIRISKVVIDGASGDSITLTNCSGVIDNVLIRNATRDCIRLLGGTHDLRIRNCKLIDGNLGLYPNDGCGVFAYQVGQNIVVEGNWFENLASGMRTWDCPGANGMVFRKNFIKNMVRPSGGSSGQACQFAYVTGSGLIISDNIIVGVNGECAFEDHISWYHSSGTAASRAMCENNKSNGAGPSANGAGISVGDGGGNYITAQNNIILRTGNGIQLVGGHDNVLTGNKCYSPQTGWSQVGCLVWRWGKVAPGFMYNCTVSNNQTYWLRYDGVPNHSYYPSTGQDGQSPNHGTIASGNVDPAGWGTNTFNDGTLSDSLWNAAWNGWTVDYNYVLP